MAETVPGKKKDPSDVVVKNTEPTPVTVVHPPGGAPDPAGTAVLDPAASPPSATTTKTETTKVETPAASQAKIDEAALTSGSQRRVNLVWEGTQASIALLVTLSALSTSAWLVSRGDHPEAFALLSNAFFMVAGFYFGRTNHQKVGGVQANDSGR